MKKGSENLVICRHYLDLNPKEAMKSNLRGRYECVRFMQVS